MADPHADARDQARPAGFFGAVVCWEPWLSRWLGWITGLTLVALGFTQVSWMLRGGLWLLGADFLLLWVVERIEGRQGLTQLRARIALLPFMYGGVLLCLIGWGARLLGH